MNTDHVDYFRSINTFPSFVKYVREDLEWPIESDNFDDSTFEYEPAELGLDAKTAANVKTIQQLRPLTTNQPWGIFFIKFDQKRLPVVALRRILSHLVVKKRQSANRAHQAVWQLHDLLFICSYGEPEHRDTTLAHFSDDSTSEDRGLPTLKVLGWDDEDTVSHLDYTDRTLKEKLRWPDDLSDVDGWRAAWSQAFILRPRQVITTSKALAVQLAKLATAIRKRVNKVLAVESETGPLRKLHVTFKEALIHDLSEDDFADMYAQTITYGLLSARVSRPEDFVTDTMTDIVPLTNPFLRDLLSTFLTAGGRQGKIDFDELGINEVIQVLRDADMEAVLRDFGDRNPQEDPVVHFYELFLKEYDPKKRMQRGVFYTPRPVVSFIVRSVDEILRTEFGLADGFADTTTWGEMAQRHPDLQIPKGAKPDDPFVQILDPACGTGTFLVEVIDLIHKTMIVKWQTEGHGTDTIKRKWNEYVPDHLLPRLYGFELMMAPYAVAHMKVGLKLHETGYNFRSHERARIYLTNTLEPPQDFSDRLAFDAPALAHEAQAVNAIKRHQRFTVVIGNPPYSKLSSNWNEWVDALLHGRGTDGAATADYYMCDGAPLGERTVWIQDDYIKFMRLSQWHIDRTGTGIHSYISNNGYLDNPTLRGMRQQLQTSFRQLYVLDLHGSTKRGEKAPDGASDENVFDIQQGVAIGVFAKTLVDSRATVRHADLWGGRDSKYRALSSSTISSLDWVSVTPVSPFHLFVPIDATYQAEYDAGWKVTDIFALYHSGIITKRDSLTIHWTANDAFRTATDFATLSSKAAREKYDLPPDVRDWKVVWAQADLRDAGLSRERVIPVLYRPFDVRFTYFTGRSRGFVGWPVADMTRLMLRGDNIALVTTRMTKGEGFAHALLSRHMVEVICLSAKTSNNGFAFPLYASASAGHGSLFKAQPEVSREPNLTPSFCKRLSEQLGLDYTTPGRGDRVRTFGPEDVFGYVVALLQCGTYRERYREFLSRDFPRLPLPGSLGLFLDLAQLGDELVALHLMESPKLARHLTTYVGPANPEVEKISHIGDTVWLDKAQTRGFRGVPEAVWNFHIGGYQVCEKWLKDRKGRTLSADDITHYHRIVVALNETIRLMAEIDTVIEAHGGWPDAFVTTKGAPVKEEPSLPFQ